MGIAVEVRWEMQVYLETERLILRRFTAADADLLVELDSDPEVMRYLTGGLPTPRDAIEREILPRMLAFYARGERYGFWAAIERATGDFLGWFHFRPGESAGPDEPELGYRLRKAAWGQGFATEASRALIRKGFAEFGARRVTAFTDRENLGSRRVMERVGMTLVRTHRLPGRRRPAGSGAEVDVVEYALERDDWEQQETSGARRAGHCP